MNTEDISHWIFASVSKHFNDLSTETGIPMFVEGQKRDTRTLGAFFELRMNGPDTSDYGSVMYCDFHINILIHASLDNVDYHRIRKLAGQVRTVFKRRMTIHDLPDLDVIGCAVLQRDYKGRTVREYHFGQVTPSILVQRASVMGSYRLILDVEQEE